MATTSTDPRDIEADLERERASLATTLDALSDRVSVDNLAKEALGMLRSHAGTATTSLDHAVRANPLAVALIGAGVAWMFLGPKVRGSSSGGSEDYASGYSSSGQTSGQYSGLSSQGSYGSSTSGSGSYAQPSTGFSADDRGWTSAQDYGRVGYVASDEDDDHAWSREAHGLRARATDALRRIEQEARSYYDSLRKGISNMTSGGGERDFDAERESVISGFASDLKARFSSGLDRLPPEARDRVVAARERAYGAMLQAERMGRDAWRDPAGALEDHPLVAGAVAFALGAAVAAALPGTDYENRTFGSERDKLMDEAQRLFRQERERAMEVAGSLGQEIKAAARETVEAVSDTVADKAQSAAHRVSDRAAEELGSGQGSSGQGKSGLAGPGDPVIG